MHETRDYDTMSERPTLGRTAPETEPERGGWTLPEDFDERETLERPVGSVGAAGTLLAGRYKVVRPLGKGGMGSVWLAEDLKLDGRRVAVKMLPAMLSGKKSAYRQVKQEALMAMKLSHSNIATVRAFEEDESGSPFLVMDYIDGGGLDDILEEKGKLTEAETRQLLEPVAAALDYAHAQGIVHRDVKPGNVMVREDGTPYVLDFGIAREIQETMTRLTGKFSSGTLLYMSPEQLNGDQSRAEQDVYSFAAMAYECLTGEPPFVRGQIEWQIMNKPPAPLPDSISEALRSGIMAGLSKDPKARPGTCAGVLGGGKKNIEKPEPRFGDSGRKAESVPNPETGDAFLRKFHLERLLEETKTNPRTLKPDEKESLARVQDFLRAGDNLLQHGRENEAAKLFGQGETAFSDWQDRVQSREKKENESFWLGMDQLAMMIAGSLIILCGAEQPSFWICLPVWIGSWFASRIVNYARLHGKSLWKCILLFVFSLLVEIGVCVIFAVCTGCIPDDFVAIAFFWVFLVLCLIFWGIWQLRKGIAVVLGRWILGMSAGLIVGIILVVIAGIH